MYNELLNISEAANLLGVSPSTLRRLEKEGVVEGYGLKVIYTPGGQRRYVLDEVQQLYSKAGFSGNLGLGKKPVLLIRDLTMAFTTEHSQLAIQLKNQIRVTAKLIDEAAKSKIPIIFSKTIYDPTNKTSELWSRKFPNIQLLDTNSRWTDIHPELSDKPYDLIYENVYVSDLYKSPIESFLEEREIDTLILAGASISGSIRATVIDALQRDYHVVIPREAVGDRTNAIETFTLMDLNARYADVVHFGDIITYFKQLR